MARKKHLICEKLQKFRISKSGKNGHFAKVMVKQYDKFGNLKCPKKQKTKKVQKTTQEPHFSCSMQKRLSSHETFRKVALDRSRGSLRQN